METFPAADPNQTGKTEQQGAESNVPKSGERPDQGKAPTIDPWAGSQKKDADERPMEAPDTLGARHQHPILAQPPEEFTGLRLGRPASYAAGITAVLKSGEFAFSYDGPVRGTHALLKLNQKDGFDCSSCAWPDPDDHRSIAEFCENGAKATASDSQSDPVGPEFFARHSLVDLSHMTDRDLNNAGRLLSACSDTEFVAAGMRKLRLSVHITPKLNRSHLVSGELALLLPCYTRIDMDMQKSGQQVMSCENSMCVVSQSKGVLQPLPGNQMLSEVAIVCGLAKATLGGRSRVDWVGCTENYDLIRDYVERTIPGFERFNEKLRQPGGFYLPNGPRERNFTTFNGKANFTSTPLEKHVLEPGQLVMMTIRSHDQFNTTIYDYNDRYRGVYHERRVIFMNREDMTERGLKEKMVVNVTSHFQGQQRHALSYLAIPYDIPKGDCAMYFPEANVLVPIGSVAYESNTPTSKFVVVTVAPMQAPVGSSAPTRQPVAVPA